jgi:hypothetical protein
VVGHLYVDDNTAGTNTIAGFDRHADGTLTPLHGSAFAAGSAGTGTGIGSQGALQATSDGKYLLAVDAGSNQISVLRIKQERAGGESAAAPQVREPGRTLPRSRGDAEVRRARRRTLALAADRV